MKPGLPLPNSDPFENTIPQGSKVALTLVLLLATLLLATGCTIGWYARGAREDAAATRFETLPTDSCHSLLALEDEVELVTLARDTLLGEVVALDRQSLALRVSLNTSLLGETKRVELDWTEITACRRVLSRPVQGRIRGASGGLLTDAVLVGFLITIKNMFSGLGAVPGS